MQKLQNIILTHSNRALNLKHAFNCLKINNLQLKTKECSTEELMNKELYLAYVEEVLNKKEHDLIELQQFLNLRESQIGSLHYEKTIQASMNSLQVFRKNEKLIYEISIKYGIKTMQFQQLKNKVQNQCVSERIQMENTLKQQFDNLIEERKILRKKLSQYAELGSYEKYLNELHDALEEKQQQISQRQKTFRMNSYNSLKPPTQESIKNKHASNNSQKRRTKIFTAKTFSSPTKLFFNNNHGFHIKDQTFGENYESIPQINESSEIMKEEDNKQIENVLLRKKNMAAISIQTKIQSYDEASKRLRQEKLKLRFIKRWLAQKFDEKNITNKRKKTLALYQWKVNACFDENISQKLQKNMQIFDKNWLKRTKLLRQQQLFPYSKLSTNRKNYLQWTFDHMRKVQHRKTIENSLKSIVRNKVRRQRLVFYYYFFKFFKNSITKVPKVQTANNHESHSRYLVSSSSQILSEDRIITPHHISEQKNVTPKSNKGMLNKSEAVKGKGKESKENSVVTKKSKKDNQLNEEKLKEYVLEKERTEKILATQCVKLEGLIKMMQIINPVIFRVSNDAFSELKTKDTSQRIEKLSSVVNSMDFKMDLFITKCRLGVANNSNKISTLQNLLGFTNSFK